MLEIGADRDVGLDIHHDEMLAVLHGEKADLGADSGLAGRIDHDVDFTIGADRLRVIGDGNLAGLHGGVEGAFAVGQSDPIFRLAGNYYGTLGGIEIDIGDGGDRNSSHLGTLGDDVGAHLARADQADADRRLSRFHPLPQIGGESRARASFCLVPVG